MPEHPISFQSYDQSLSAGEVHTSYNTQKSSRHVHSDQSDIPGAAPHPSSLSSINHFNTDSNTADINHIRGLDSADITHSPPGFAGFDYTNSVPMWDWDNTIIDFNEIAHAYQPQGELVQELQNQHPPAQDFTIPPVQLQAHDSIPPPSQSPIATLNTPTSNHAEQPPSTLPPPSRPTSIYTGMKRKSDSEPASATSVTGSTVGDAPPAKRTAKPRTPSASDPKTAILSESQGSVNSSRTVGDFAGSTGNVVSSGDNGARQNEDTTREATRRTVSTAASRNVPLGKERTIADSSITGKGPILPAGKVFPIQIGSELFRLSGASISSDAPSYFSQFFSEQLQSHAGRAGNINTCYIDRDPITFRDISMHLQGYHVAPRDGEHFVKLFADAQFYSLPRLIQQLFKADIFIEIGGRPFKISRDLFNSPGDSPNFFSLGFAHFFSTPSNTFPGLDQKTLLRPPAIHAPALPNRSGDIFAELLHILKGYPVHVRNEAHRAELLRDARYFNLKGLEQRLIRCGISYSLTRDQTEILIRLDDIRQSGISVALDSIVDDANTPPSSTAHLGLPGSKPTTPSHNVVINNSHPGVAVLSGSIKYSRPYVDDTSHVLILETSNESARLDLQAMRAEFVGQTKARIASLFQIIANKMNLPATQPLGLMMMASGGGVAAQPPSPANSGVSEHLVKIRVDDDACILLDGEELDPPDEDVDMDKILSDELQLKLKRRMGFWKVTRDDMGPTEWIVRKGHWRIRVQQVEETGKVEVVMCAVRLDAFSSERSRNRHRGFLT
ncbi:hypothetical protein M501DRAFT_994453 [Patellaria atrata CBS 101060]|uniref:Potassium channel tetramerisation-type BTB domain-containing protein n=1 Tax=Patellaria atrata CBS 101060 TaxID=1346257 RepID=A0A9P4VX74_9PEZI|nr:hypothetical protein M501DRAFT_994453 [Patellaria atrata CBS 101060]